MQNNTYLYKIQIFVELLHHISFKYKKKNYVSVKNFNPLNLKNVGHLWKMVIFFYCISQFMIMVCKINSLMPNYLYIIFHFFIYYNYYTYISVFKLYQLKKKKEIIQLDIANEMQCIAHIIIG